MKGLTLTAEPIVARIGCEIMVDKRDLIGGHHSAEIRDLLVKHGVLCFPGVGLSDDEQTLFAASLGPVVSDHDVSADRSVNSNAAMAEYQKSSVFWHFDGFGVKIPEFATMMSPRMLADGQGGATEFANCYAAYEELSDEDKTALDQLQVHHSFETLMRMVKPHPEAAELKAWQDGGHAHSHPLVWHHGSGRNSLLLGSSASHIEGLGSDESRTLIERLTDWIVRPENVYRYEWGIGDLVIWDNTGTLHRAVPYSHDSKRLMHRTTIAGTETPS
jgi:alpha-ketoglutarate-dependent taurine dioxygenase